MTEIRKMVGQRIKQARLKAGLSQEQLAELAEIHVSYVGQVERGEKSASLPVLDRISQSLEVSLPQMVENTELRETKTPYKIRPKWKQVAKLLENLDDKTLNLVTRLIRQMKKVNSKP